MQQPPDIEHKPVARVALLGRDYRSVNFELLCEVGDRVQAGAALMRDARRPQILFCSPVAGRVSKIERGARRKLNLVRIEREDSIGAVRQPPPRAGDRAESRSFMLQTGAWSFLRTRPFGNVPDADAEPAALFITAMDAEPQALPAAAVIDHYADCFHSAVELLEGIIEAPIYICHAPGKFLRGGGSARADCVAFAGGYAAGLPGFHINRLCPIGFNRGQVWHLGYQQVIALGHLLLEGEPWQQRIISLGGDAVKNPRSLMVPPGASIEQLLGDELNDPGARVFAGSPMYAREVDPGQGFLECGQRQLMATATANIAARNGGGELIPGDLLEAVAPPGIYPVPLMRALQLGDVERARELGALELVEEDVAPLSLACSSRSDYGGLLRDVLDQLEASR